MPDWRKLLALSWSDRGVLLQAAVLLVHARLALPFIDFRAARTEGGEPRAVTLPGMVPARAQAIARLVGIAAAHVPVDVACLHRSVVLWWLLRRRGISCELRLGAGNDGGPFQAHAWVECAGIPLNEGADHLSRYRPFGNAVVPVGRLWWRPATRRAS